MHNPVLLGFGALNPTRLQSLIRRLHAPVGRFDDSQPAKTLLEASSRRAARHALGGAEGQDARGSAVDQTAAVAAFMASYAAAAAARDCKWATAPAVAALFAESAVLVSQDKQMVYGRNAVTARLNRGIARQPCNLEP